METTTARPVAAETAAVDAKHVSWLLTLGVIWGSSYLFIKVLVEAVSPAVMIAGRFALGFLTLAIILKVRHEQMPRGRRSWGLLLVMSIFGNIIPFFLIAWAEQHTTSALAAVLSATTPLFTLIFAALVFGNDRLTQDRVLGLAVGFAGVALLTGRSILDIASTSGLGVLALLGSSVCYGFTFAFARQYIRGNPASNVTAQSLISLVIITPIALLTGWVHTEHLHASNIAAWVILGAVGTGIAYLFYYALIREIGATPSSLVTYIIPVVGLFLGWLILDEHLGLNGIAGMLLIGAGVAVSYGWHRGRGRRGNRE